MKANRASRQTASAQSWFGGCIPIILGAVGHRELSGSENAIIRTARKECRRLRRDYRRSPFIVLSGLAEGADRIVARIAMEELGAKLIAVLPFPAEDFSADFATKASRQEFFDLLSQAASVVEAPLPPDGKWKQDGDDRDRQYARVGALIAEQSQILIALWDNRPARGIGGTADVVDWFERGYAPREFSIYEGDLSLFDPPQPGLCIMIDPATAERKYHNVKPARLRSIRTTRNDIIDILRRTEIYNRDVQRKAAYRVKKADLVPPKILARAPINEALAAFREADALSIFYAKRVRLADLVLCSLAVAAVFAVNLIDEKPIASWSFLGVMAVIIAVIAYVSGQSLDTKFQEYRSLAEAMRILFFWRMLGLRRQVWLSYLSKHGSVVRWLKHAVRALELAQDGQLPRPGATSPDEAAYEAAIQYWIGSQIAYFKRRVIHHSNRYWWGMLIANIGFTLTFLSALLLGIMACYYRDGWDAWQPNVLVPHPLGLVPLETFIGQLQIVVSLAGALGIAARGFLLRSADLELTRQYMSAQDKYDRAEAAIGGVPDGDPRHELPGIFDNLGAEALLEQAEWLWLRHSRPFEPPS